MKKFTGFILFMAMPILMFVSGTLLYRFPIAILSKELTGYLVPALYFGSLAFLGGGGMYYICARRPNTIIGIWVLMFGSGMVLMWWPPNILSRQLTGYLAPSLLFASMAYLAGIGTLAVLMYCATQTQQEKARS